MSVCGRIPGNVHVLHRPTRGHSGSRRFRRVPSRYRTVFNEPHDDVTKETSMDRTLRRSTYRGAIALAAATLLVGATTGTASAAQDLCVSVNGVVQVQQGTATCSSWPGTGNVAIARGAHSNAVA